MTLARGLAQLVNNNHNTDFIGNSAQTFRDIFYYGDFANLYSAVWIAVILWAAFNFLLSKTRTGRHIYAVGSNLDAARLSGINEYRTILITYLVSAFCACVTGLILLASAGMLILKYPNLYADTALLYFDSPVQFFEHTFKKDLGEYWIDRMLYDKVLFGSTYPRIEQKRMRKAVDSLTMLPKDYIAYQLTGVHSMDYSDASGTLLLDVEHKCWSEKILRLCGVETDWLPTLFESYQVTGTVKSALAAELGLGTGCVVAAGAGDNAAAAVGTGTVGEGRCNVSLGTSGTIFISSRSFRVDRRNALHAFAHADGRYHLMGCMLSAASCNQWWMDSIIGTKDYAAQQAGMPVSAKGRSRSKTDCA